MSDEKTPMSILPSIGWVRDWGGKLVIALLMAVIGYSVSALQAKAKMETTVSSLVATVKDHENRIRVDESRLVDIEVLKNKMDNLKESIDRLNKTLINK